MSGYDFKKIALGIIVLVVIVSLVIFGIFFIFSKFNKDSWIKDQKGIWITEGNPENASTEIKEQQNAISCASGLYAENSLKNISFVSQCLGSCGNYSVDVVNVPRTSDDDLKTNQCSDFSEGKLKHLIELNKQGNIVRII